MSMELQRTDIAGHPACIAMMPDGRLCMREATVQLQMACIHEHMRTPLACEDCAAIALAGHGACHACGQGQDPHICALIEVSRADRGQLN